MTLPRIALMGGAITVLLIVLYAAFGPGANQQNTPGVEPASLEALRLGDMKKLVFHSEPRPPVATAFLDADGAETDLSAYEGKTVLVNFWATWCAPCLKEMPALDKLQQVLGGDRFAVVTIATGRNPPKMIDVFFERAAIENLPKLRDPSQELARAMSVFGLPTSMVLDGQGREIARLRGDADWASEEAVALLKAVVGDGG